MAFEDIKIGDRVIVNDDGNESSKVKVVGFYYLLDMDLLVAKTAQEAIAKSDCEYFGVIVDITKPKDKRMYFKQVNGFGFECKDIMMIYPLADEGKQYTKEELVDKINTYRFKLAQREISNLSIWTHDDLLKEAKRLDVL